MTIALGSTAPNFTAQSTTGELNFHDFIGESWCLFFSHPRNFSAVCMTELGYVSRLKPELDRLNTKALGLSIVELDQHTRWAPEFEDAQGMALNFPLVADANGEIADLFGMIHPEHMAGVTCRCFFIIDPQHKIRMYSIYPTGVGRNFEEILRIIKALQTSDRHGLVTPVNWQPGDLAVIPPKVSDELARERYPEGWKTITPYLRLVEVPD
jgi:alkyl hydroperoxide reductase subunit AhpC